MPYRQDMPPKGGYPRIATTPDLPVRGPGGFVIYGLALLGMTIGGFAMLKGAAPMADSLFEWRRRRHLVAPFLQAEEDFKFVLEHNAQMQEQDELLKDWKEYKAYRQPYKTRWMPPTHAPANM